MTAKRNKYQDILVIVIGFAIIGLIFKFPYLVYGALSVGVICALSETIARYVAMTWEKLGLILGTISSTILLSLLFILVMVPLSTIRKITTRTSKDELANSNWEKTEMNTVDFEKQW